MQSPFAAILTLLLAPMLAAVASPESHSSQPLTLDDATLKTILSLDAHITQNNLADDHLEDETTNHHHHRQMQQQQGSENKQDELYEILTSDKILERLQKLVANYPNFATLTTTQEWFGLPRAGEYYCICI